MDVIGDLERAFAAAIYPNRVLVAVGGIGVLLALAIVARRWRWDRPVRRNPRAGIVGLILVLAVALPLGWYLGSPLFTSTTIDEPPPVAAVEPIASAVPPAPSNGPTPSFSDARDTIAGALCNAGSADRALWNLHRSGRVPLREGHGPADRDVARRVHAAPREVRGPQRAGPSRLPLSVANGYGDGAIELGQLKADRGNQNYVVPGGVDVAGAASVVIWCKQFSVLFATAPLSP